MSESSNSETKQIARKLVSDAWEQAMEKGVSKELMASTAFTAALTSLSEIYGRESAAHIAERLVEKLRVGMFDQSR